MSHKRTTTIFVTLTAITLVLSAWGFWPRGSRLKLFTSAPFVCHGRKVRIQLLLPENLSLYTPVSASNGVLVFCFFPPEFYPWMPERIRDWYYRKYPMQGMAVVNVGDATPMDEAIHADYALDGLHKSLKGKPNATLYYFGGAAVDFKTSYRKVCESFKVIPEK